MVHMCLFLCLCQVHSPLCPTSELCAALSGHCWSLTGQCCALGHLSSTATSAEHFSKSTVFTSLYDEELCPCSSIDFHKMTINFATKIKSSTWWDSLQWAGMFCSCRKIKGPQTEVTVRITDLLVIPDSCLLFLLNVPAIIGAAWLSFSRCQHTYNAGNCLDEATGKNLNLYKCQHANTPTFSS